MASEKKTKNDCLATDWLEDDNLMLLECWARDGYTLQDIANRIGISYNTLRMWRDKYPEIKEALRKGKEIIDYQVENALLKSALGYKTKEVKVITTVRYGKTVETVREVTDKEQAPNVSAIQCWLFNRMPDKWKRNRDQLIELEEEDTKIQVTVTRASQSTKAQPTNGSDNEVDEDWQDEVNQSIEIRSATEEERKAAAKRKAEQAAQNDSNMATKVENESSDEDLDYWPDDWEDEEED